MLKEQNKNEVISLIKELKQYDNDEGYKVSYKKIKKKLENTTKKLAEFGEECVEYIHPLLEHEETWSCLFALEILREIKSEKSILPLINFLKNNENSDYWEGCDNALFALNDIGEPAIMPLLREIRSSFQNKTHPVYLVGALTGIKHDDVYSFMVETLKDYIGNKDKYDEWFKIEHFTYDFEKQDKKEVLPLLKKLVAMGHLSRFEKVEIEDTIGSIEDPEKFKKEMEDMAKGFEKYKELKKEDVNEKELLEKALDFEAKKDFGGALDCLAKILAVYPKSYHALFLKVRIKRRMGKPDLISLNNALKEAKRQEASKEVLDLMEMERKKINNLHREAETTADVDLELNFKCNDCKKRQNLKPGLIWFVKEGYTFLFENEIMCKYCFSHNLELTNDAHMDLLGQQMRMLTGESCGILHTGEKVYAENKLIKFSEAYPYLLRRIKEEPHNSELQLRAGNSARKKNKYEDAINHYERAIELNPKLIAAYLNLVEIYQYRHDYYKIEDTRDKAISYLKKMKELYESKDYNAVTLQNYRDSIQFIREKEADLGLSSGYKMLKEKDIEKTLKKASTLNMESVFKNIKKMAIDSEEAKQLLEEGKGIMVFQSYHVFDKKTKESKRLEVASVEPADPSKLCICGSEKYLKDCCFKDVIKKKPFVINTDYATYSAVCPINRKIETNEDYDELIDGFKDDPGLYCDDEKNRSAFFIYYGNTFYTVKELGTVVFGTLEIKKGFTNRAIIEMKALSQNRFDSLNDAVKEHLGHDED